MKELFETIRLLIERTADDPVRLALALMFLLAVFAIYMARR
jgi:hypothetical protein